MICNQKMFISTIRSWRLRSMMQSLERMCTRKKDVEGLSRGFEGY
ncbi:MAG: hypothetical protein SOW57_08545 [Prevotella sp.]|nr:hypothetical protein [Prevotella sp.]